MLVIASPSNESSRKRGSSYPSSHHPVVAQNHAATRLIPKMGSRQD
jgi:hypothetical protein